jgi:hypothetical protein
MLQKVNLRTAFLLLSILVGCSFTVSAQARQPISTSVPPASSSGAKGDSDEDKTTIGTMDEEMRAKRLIKFAEKEYQDNVKRAREVAELGAELRDSMKEGRSFGREETKKLERVEKLTKKIRTDAGGSDEDDSITDPPGQLDAALSRLADVSASLYKTVEKTPRQVISATVIVQANVVLQLTKIARRLFH